MKALLSRPEETYMTALVVHEGQVRWTCICFVKVRVHFVMWTTNTHEDFHTQGPMNQV
jgi:hypothetical protein